MKRVNQVTLEHFSNEYFDDLASFQLPEEQAKFTTLPSKYVEVTEGQFRIVILKENEPVGFFLLHSTKRVKEYSDNPNAMLLTSLSVNQAQQGQGYAKQAISLLGDFIKSEFVNCNEIVLAVNHKNTSAHKLYSKMGYEDTGRRINGPIGEQFVMSLLL
ncbi:Protein N-acetyltransferase, RimJ/RimL family [Pelagirhabdus alkalitolerans]|uniref:Protein N-acetyltransferase, RimJ/RimL family n=1 Tax=Pelagirhabdus alkalitolerans TaxID=1612202 RepID=A0A1G6GHV2_9BACI|nr:GNAT family N-acetyltransferase [Pelagirhabdus alkalitolerans]SDB81602.1 Protein N-acetyltransferase, RimJ/RimL family [Pelagirhabdus alkalitolerans]